jgi:hypothetical protein
MKLENKFFAALIAVVFAFAFIACEGPAGEDGMDGADGAAGMDGKDGEEQCGVCHNSSSLLYAKQLEWEASMHGSGTSYSYAGGRSGCAACHAGQAFEIWAETGSMEEASVTLATPTPVTCYTCHNIHDSYSTDDYALKGTQAFNLIGDMTDNIEVDMGDANLCGKCHQARPRGYGLDPANGGDVSITSSHWGPHYGTQTNMFLAAGGYETAGGNYTGNNPHGSIPNGCVSCHTVDGNHTFAANDASCQSCHPGLEGFDYDGFQTEIAEMIMTLEDHLVNLGVIAIEHEGEHGHPVVTDPPTVISNEQAGAMWNYFQVVNDGSHGVHNPRYIKALLENSIAIFE